MTLKIKALKFKPLSRLGDKSGQSFIEFIMILALIMGLSFAMLRGFNGGISDRWLSLIQAISAPTDTPIQVR